MKRARRARGGHVARRARRARRAGRRGAAAGRGRHVGHAPPPVAGRRRLAPALALVPRGASVTAGTMAFRAAFTTRPAAAAPATPCAFVHFRRDRRRASPARRLARALAGPAPIRLRAGGRLAGPAPPVAPRRRRRPPAAAGRPQRSPRAWRPARAATGAASIAPRDRRRHAAAVRRRDGATAAARPAAALRCTLAYGCTRQFAGHERNDQIARRCLPSHHIGRKKTELAYIDTLANSK